MVTDKLNLYLIEQTANYGYGTYDSAVVVSESPELAARIHPDGDGDIQDNIYADQPRFKPVMRGHSDWVTNPALVTVIYLGPCMKPNSKDGDIICASFIEG